MAIPLPFPHSMPVRRLSKACTRGEGALRADSSVVGLAIPLGLVALAMCVRVFNLLALEPFGDEVTWLRWALDKFDPRQPATFWTPLEDEGRPPLFFWLL